MTSATQSAELRHRIEHALTGLRNAQGELESDQLREFVDYFCIFLEDLKCRMQPPTPAQIPGYRCKVLSFRPIANHKGDTP